jgi:hypothetical protein
MAKIRVYRNEADGEDFPRLCMCCGQPAECDVPQTFAWMPGWVHVFILFGLAPWLVAALVMRKTMRVVAPMCSQHAGHWRTRKLYVWLGLLFWIAYATALILFWDKLPESAQGPAILVGMIGSLVWLISAAIYANGAIKASDIRERGMELVNVNRDFADAWNDG